ncbi:hypothetical protein [Natrialba sp. INN-245]|uniref:hypothetical protein n=1 Tax=Natrialba sp. INN-245 TaxID=2690967 RepID=UPI001310B649|nr:hypothetical protein [Natrialba sp. INN-245]MWV40875.1 hypothetical protein [Natrialba sp. INN-245]
MDTIDTVTIVGFAALGIATTIIDGTVAAAAFGGFALSLSCWRVYGGRPWEGIAWLLWVLAALVIVLVPAGTAFLVLFFGCLLGGVFLLFGSRLEQLPDIWSVDME